MAQLHGVRDVNTNIKAVILCGGQSSRMGSDKALIQNQDGIIWSKHIYDILSTFNLDIYLSIRDDQQSQFDKYFQKKNFVLDNFPSVNGPLRGILSTYQSIKIQHKDNFYLLVVATDMPTMNREIIQTLIKSVQQNSIDLSLYKNSNGFFEPLCAIYSSQLLENWLTLESNNHSIHYRINQFLRTSNAYQVLIPSNEILISNYNTKESLDILYGTK